MNILEIGRDVVLKGIIRNFCSDNVHVQIGSKIIVMTLAEAKSIKGTIKAIYGNTIHVLVNSKVLAINASELSIS